jgi:hypothetical protein
MLLMKNNPPPTPYTVSIKLKTDDRTDVCPDIDRCQLEILEDYRDSALRMFPGIENREVIAVGIKQENKDCNIKIRVGIVESGGPIAIGAREYTFDGLFRYEVWERKLQGCIPPKKFFLDSGPVGLINVRYKLNKETVSVITAKMVSGEWQIIVERRGGTVKSTPFKIQVSDIDAVVSAAISKDLQKLYIITSKLNGSVYRATWQTHGYDKYSGNWFTIRSGSISHPTGAADMDRPFHVNRDGHVSGYWFTDENIDTDSHNDTENESGTWYSDYTTKSRTYTKIWGGYWDLTKNGEYVDAGVRNSGQVIVNGDISLISESLNLSSAIVESSNYRRLYNLEQGALHGEWYRSYTAKVDYKQRFNVKIGTKIVDSTGDVGQDFNFAANSSAFTDVWIVPGEGVYTHDVFTETFTLYHNNYGTKRLDRTIGGWVSIIDSELSTIPVDMSSYEIDHTTLSQVFIEGWGYSLYPNFLADLEVRGLNGLEGITKNIIYPEKLGSYYAIHRSFTSYDQESATEYSGVYLQKTAGGSIAWRIFKDGQEVTEKVSNCISKLTYKPMSQLYAIYWRA